MEVCPSWHILHRPFTDRIGKWSVPSYLISSTGLGTFGCLITLGGVVFISFGGVTRFLLFRVVLWQHPTQSPPDTDVSDPVGLHHNDGEARHYWQQCQPSAKICPGTIDGTWRYRAVIISAKSTPPMWVLYSDTIFGHGTSFPLWRSVSPGQQGWQKHRSSPRWQFCCLSIWPQQALHRCLHESQSFLFIGGLDLLPVYTPSSGSFEWYPNFWGP